MAIVALGSNIDPERHLPEAVAALRALGAMAVSSVYQNPPRGGLAQPDFLNAAALVQTTLDADRLRVALRSIEAELGRIRGPDKYAPRTIDLDLLMLDEVIDARIGATLPDPELLTTAHLALPAAEVAPMAVHPLTGEPLRDIAERLRPAADLRLRSDVTAQAQAALRGEV